MADNILMMVWLILFPPLAGGCVAAFFGRKMPPLIASLVTIIGVLISFVVASQLAYQVLIAQPGTVQEWNCYTWVATNGLQFPVGFLIDSLSIVMIEIVTFVSLLVHIYSIGYMKNDPDYHRFFAYMSWFTFAMLCLIVSNGFVLLFFGWEGVGLISYLLIGFWYEKPSAAVGAFKAFLVNRVGDFGFLLGIGLVVAYTGTVQYSEVFAQAPQLTTLTVGHYAIGWPTAVCLLLFVGAMGKSAQLPLQVWLPESMEGPTPISALIHAATMVTAGVYLVARLSPLFELSEVALNVVLIIGATGALLMGLVGLVQNDIKRVIAYSTMSQLGYMMAGNGVSAFPAAIFHLGTHACFKALLFLAAGSVIMGMHHEQDIRQMGGLRRWMPVTYVMFLIGACALSALPPFSGFYSKEVIIEAVSLSSLSGASYAYGCLVIGAFVTALYIFRTLFLVFHGTPRFSHHGETPHESPWVVLVPLIALAIPSALVGIWLVEPFLYHEPSWLASSVTMLDTHPMMKEITHHFEGVWESILEVWKSPPFYASILGVTVAWWKYGKGECSNTSLSMPSLKGKLLRMGQAILVEKFGFDRFYQWFFVGGSRQFGRFFYKIVDLKLIDGTVVNGSAQFVGWVASIIRQIQTGYLYHYAFAMILGSIGLLIWLLC